MKYTTVNHSEYTLNESLSDFETVSKAINKILDLVESKGGDITQKNYDYTVRKAKDDTIITEVSVYSFEYLDFNIASLKKPNSNDPYSREIQINFRYDDLEIDPYYMDFFRIYYDTSNQLVLEYKLFRCYSDDDVPIYDKTRVVKGDDNIYFFLTHTFYNELNF